ncbi:MAG TPA: DUF6766 family protein [Miltoncostaea sp.]|nr:DUF6766 family protein [Miltoncostaea sp.]
MSRAGRFVRGNSLSLVFLVIFLAALAGQAFAGWHLYNDDQHSHHDPGVSLARYLTSSRFAVETTENWQSEFLQFTLYIAATIWLIQRGSSESKEPGEEGAGSDEEQRLGAHATGDSPKWARVGGLRTAIYSNSLVLVFGILFLASWGAQSVSGWRDFNDEQVQHGEGPISWARYLTEPDFWDRTLQNWQSEFLAVGSMAIFAVYLRQRGSPESKPVGAPHDATG